MLLTSSNVTYLRLFRRVLSRTVVYQEKMHRVFKHDYEEAIGTLNKLQSNANALKNRNNDKNEDKLKKVEKYIMRSGINLNEIEKLPVLHVSGTKGKGSTCGFCESILRHHGYKTGFFSSPHLYEVRERIRINGVPISKVMFSEYFWKIFTALDKQKENPLDIAFYFQFLFIMAIHIFLREEVDVAIIEVGIGGEYDPTNIVKNVPVAGITSLGYDHTSILGDTIQSIAWNKAGIMKKDSNVFTVTQPHEAYEVLHKRSIERNCKLTVIQNICHLPCIQKYPSPIQTNINLAIKLAEAWMLAKPKQPNNNSLLDLDILKYSLENFHWPGRFEIRQEKNLRFYIDGAHTLESITLCLNWYLNDVKKYQGRKCLLFNLTGNRPFTEFFKLLKQGQFETVIFVPNIAKPCQDLDNMNMVSPIEEQLTRCNVFKEKWLNEDLSMTDVQVFSCIQHALEYLNEKGRCNILLTGSLHLVGAALSLLEHH